MYIQVDNVFGSVSCEAKGKFNCRFSGTFLNFFLNNFRDFAERSGLRRLLNEVSGYFCRAK